MESFIVFDFNGTLVHSTQIMNEILTDLIHKSCFKSLSSKDFEKVSGLPFFKKIRVFIFFAIYQKKFLQMFHENIERVQFADGVGEMLMELNKRQQKFSVLSSNTSATIMKFFELYDIKVDCVYKSQRLFGKKNTFKKYMKRNKCKAHQVTYICDERRDIQACNKSGVQAVFVTWGLDSREDVVGLEADVVEMPAELGGFLLAKL